MVRRCRIELMVKDNGSGERKGDDVYSGWRVSNFMTEVWEMDQCFWVGHGLQYNRSKNQDFIERCGKQVRTLLLEELEGLDQGSWAGEQHLQVIFNHSGAENTKTISGSYNNLCMVTWKTSSFDLFNCSSGWTTGHLLIHHIYICIYINKRRVSLWRSLL